MDKRRISTALAVRVVNPVVRWAVRHGLAPGSYASPRVRIKLRDGWRSGTAQVLDDDDPQARLRRMGLRINALVVRLMGTELLTVRIDLDP